MAHTIPPRILDRIEDSGKCVRDPVLEYIDMAPEIEALVDTVDFQRLRQISQLGHVSLVYPGARHSRFEHSLGVYHLAKRFLQRLLRSDPPLTLDLEDVKVCTAAALLHDIGHYPFSHVLEELTSFFAHHEARGRRLILDPEGEIHRVLRKKVGIDPERVANVVDPCGPEREIPERDRLLARILSGTLDPDKVDYLLRDSLYCGVPFGLAVNKGRLINSITYDPTRQKLAITDKGICAIESLIFTNYLMYRNVYWHHTARAATAMFKRVVWEVVSHPECRLTPSDFERIDEHQLMDILGQQIEKLGNPDLARFFTELTRRRLYKVARSFQAQEKTTSSFMHVFYDLYRHSDKRHRMEVELARGCGRRLRRNLPDNAVLIDIPAFHKTLQVDLDVRHGARSGRGSEEWVDFGDPRVSRLKEYLVDNFESHAKVFRVFTLDDPAVIEDVGRSVKRQLMAG
ncbi:MAG: HD domain-containing protein [Candidatus Riflebacteria bacterium]|nr:HD domain-containing protein [Candidatus Riflebacteria bacterium]